MNKEVELGSRIRKLRLLKQMSQQELAERANVTSSFLSQLERGKSGASMTTTVSLANALGVRLANLFQDGDDAAVFTRYADLPVLGLNEGHSKSLVSPQNHPTIEMFFVQVSPGHKTAEVPYAFGRSDEFIVGISGVMTAEIGQDSYEIRSGDVVHFKTSSPHVLLNSSDQEAEVLILMTPPGEYSKK